MDGSGQPGDGRYNDYRMSAWVGLIPPLLAALFGGWCGNLLGGATAAGSCAALAALLLTLAACGGPWRDPPRLGRVAAPAPPAPWGAGAATRRAPRRARARRRAGGAPARRSLLSSCAGASP